MADNILTATVAPVPFGNIEIEGLLLENGEFAVSVQQLNELISFSASNNVASRDLKRILGEDFSPSKVKLDILRQLINCILLPDVEKILFRLALKGNLKAVEISESLIGLSLTQLFSDAFGRKFDKEDRQNWLKSRQQTKKSFWWLVEDIKVYIETYGSSSPRHHYMNAFKAMSVGLFGKEPNQIKAELGITKGELNRDHFNDEALRRIDMVQTLAKANLENGLRPTDAVNSAITLFKFSVIDYKNKGAN
jgi:hypothetical protein